MRYNDFARSTPGAFSFVFLRSWEAQANPRDRASPSRAPALCASAAALCCDFRFRADHSSGFMAVKRR
jgi:hypothetical protein